MVDRHISNAGLLTSNTNYVVSEDNCKKTLLQDIKPLKVFANGDLILSGVTHYCNGCCLDGSGQKSRAIQIRNVVDSLSI